MRQCKRCKEWKPGTLEFFHSDKSKLDGFHIHCKTCRKESRSKNPRTPEENRMWALRWIRNNPEKHRASSRKWAKDNPEKARAKSMRRRVVLSKVDNTLTSEEWTSIIEEFNGQCAYCPNHYEEQDHLIPLSKGGSHSFNNVVPACLPCNRSKSDKLPLDWLNS